MEDGLADLDLEVADFLEVDLVEVEVAAGRLAGKLFLVRSHYINFNLFLR